MSQHPAQVIRADSRHLPLSDNSVDLVVTSPPYFGLRSYQDGGEHYAGQIGDEPTPDEFIAGLLEVTRECVRVLKPTGSLFVNLGDKYAGSRMDGSNGNGSHGTLVTKHRAIPEGQKQPRVASAGNIPTKSLMLIPQRYAIACVDELGLILRAELIWDKPNGLPESVTDRVRRSHEQWWHFTLQPRYYSAVDEIREPHVATTTGRDTSAWRTGPSGQNRGTDVGRRHEDGGRVADFATSPLGKLPGSVWSIPTQPLKVPAHLGVDHFAAFPMEWPRRIIRGWSPAGVCTACGEGRRPVRESEGETQRDALRRLGGNERHDGAGKQGLDFAGSHNVWRTHRITGERCACPDTTAPTTPGVVLDPFGGTGTTALMAKALGRRGISVDMSADYCRLAEWRTTDPGELARAMQVEKPPAVIDGQLGMFEDGAA